MAESKYAAVQPGRAWILLVAGIAALGSVLWLVGSQFGPSPSTTERYETFQPGDCISELSSRGERVSCYSTRAVARVLLVVDLTSPAANPQTLAAQNCPANATYYKFPSPVSYRAGDRQFVCLGPK